MPPTNGNSFILPNIFELLKCANYSARLWYQTHPATCLQPTKGALIQVDLQTSLTPCIYKEKYSAKNRLLRTSLTRTSQVDWSIANRKCWQFYFWTQKARKRHIFSKTSSKYSNFLENIVHFLARLCVLKDECSQELFVSVLFGRRIACEFSDKIHILGTKLPFRCQQTLHSHWSTRMDAPSRNSYFSTQPKPETIGEPCRAILENASSIYTTKKFLPNFTLFALSFPRSSRNVFSVSGSLNRRMNPFRSS